MSGDLTRRTFLSKTSAGIACGLALVLPDSARSLPASASGKRGEGIDERDGMVLIPAGVFQMGTAEAQAKRLAAKYGYHVSWLDGERPQREINLSAFWIDKYPVTNRHYHEFCKATRLLAAKTLEWPQAAVGIAGTSGMHGKSCGRGGFCKVGGKAAADRSRVGKGGARNRRPAFSLGECL